MGDEEATTIELDIPQQGLSLRLSRDDALEFFRAERGFLEIIQGWLGEQIELFGRGVQAHRHFVGTLRRELDEIISRVEKSSNPSVAVTPWLERAQRNGIIVGQSELGAQIKRIAQHHAKTAGLMYAVLSFDLVDDTIASLRAPVLASLGLSTVQQHNVVAAVAAARENEAEVRRLSSDLETFHQKQAGLFHELEQLYRRQLTLQEPAHYWLKVKRWRTAAWIFSLLLFFALVMAPVVAIVVWWTEFVAAIAAITIKNDHLSLAGVAAISLPAALYLWLLKNVSRLFLHQLAVADDAAHRRSLSLTYLGLAANKDLNIEEKDRALILNALFRPTPSHSGDEGPPLGLIDLIRSKS